jgi:O-antigen ligase
MWQSHPIIGNGFLQFYAFNISNGDPHNFVIGYLGSVGILGTVAFFAYIFKVKGG